MAYAIVGTSLQRLLQVFFNAVSKGNDPPDPRRNRSHSLRARHSLFTVRASDLALWSSDRSGIADPAAARRRCPVTRGDEDSRTYRADTRRPRRHKLDEAPGTSRIRKDREPNAGGGRKLARYRPHMDPETICG